MTNVLVWAPDAAGVNELSAKVTGLGLTPVAAVLSDDVDANTLIQHGAASVIKVSDAKLADLESGVVVDALAACAAEAGATAVFIHGGKRGKEVAPALAVKMDAACITLAHAASHDGGKWSFERMYLGGKTVATEIPTTENVVVTLPPRSADPLAADAGRSGETKTITPTLRDARVKVVSKKQKEAAEVDIEAATIVVGAGRGFKEKADLDIGFALAKAMGGQLGCTRPLATDLGWLTDDYWIGLSGKEVKPKVYVAAGISGQIQHTTGIRGAKIIVAINTNKDAPIFKMADYGIVGDLYKVLPALKTAVENQ